MDRDESEQHLRHITERIFELADACDDLDLSSGHGIRIKELTISNLADSINPNLIRSEGWNKLLRLPTLVDLKILVKKDFAFLGENTFHNEMDEFFQAFPSQWLSPSVVENLQVLSLFYSHYWGWFPRMDFSQIGALPYLKVLALGSYIFSNERD